MILILKKTHGYLELSYPFPDNLSTLSHIESLNKVHIDRGMIALIFKA